MGAMSKFIQNDFSGGMNYVSDDSALKENQYVWAMNARNRDGFLEPCAASVQDTAAPTGTMKGVYAYGNILVLFVLDAVENVTKAYYRSLENTEWTEIVGLELDPTVEQIYACAVPISTMNFARRLPADQVNVAIKIVNSVTGSTPAALVVQDGVTQPYLIFPDGTYRSAYTYAEWQSNDREYVPIGRQMAYFNGKLFIVSADGKRIYHSVSGRGLDFMVNVDSSGNKATLESDGGASTTSHAVDSNEITVLSILNTSALFVGTRFNGYAITLDFANLRFGEPTFRNQQLFVGGTVNNNCVIELRGDNAFVDFEGIRSMDAVEQLTFEGQNSVFSRAIANLLKGITQTRPAAINFNNYAIFSLETIMGDATLIYDTLTESWVSIDLTPIGKIVQFAIATTATENRLYGINTNGELWWIYGSSDSESAAVYTRSFVCPDPELGMKSLSTEHKSVQMRAAFSKATAEGTAYAVEFVNGQRGNDRIGKTIRDMTSGVLYPVQPPVFADSESQTDVLTYVFPESKTGWKIAYSLLWTNNARLTAIQLESKTVTARQSTDQMVSYAQPS